MAESKNVFTGSKMNQDLDARLIKAGEYRNALNISVSQSEGSDVGTLQTVLGNTEDQDFNSSIYCNVKINGYFVDEIGKNIYVFLTNFIDTSNDKLSYYPSDNSICEIWRKNIETNKLTKLVQGKFLNFSLTHPIENVNLLEDLLFWTDNRNQPRKINVNKANPASLTTPTYYTNDDQINVAKYYPHDPISLIKNYVVSWSISNDGGSPAGRYDDYLNQVLSTSGGSGTGLTFKLTAVNVVDGSVEAVEIVDQGIGYENGDVVILADKVGNATLTLVVEEQSTMKDVCSEFLPFRASYVYNSGTPGGATIQNNVVVGSFGFDPTDSNINIQNGTLENNLTGSSVKLYSGGVDVTPYKAYADLVAITFPPPVNPFIRITWPNDTPASVANVDQIVFGANPDYNSDWPGDCEYLKDKFVRFAYRFKFDDNEYSLISPFTQACFIPKQDGYFLKKTLEKPNGDEVEELDSTKAYEDTDVEFYENKVRQVELLIPCPKFLDDSQENFNNLTSQMHVSSIEIIYKDDSENVLKVLDTIDRSSFENFNQPYLPYIYQSRKPIKVLPESEITRVSDRVPIKALTQEVTGNRVVYGNFVDGHTAMETLNYEVSAGFKSFLTDTNIRKEYQNHTLKQNRNYQVGVVLVDRYGRSSDVILSKLDNTSSEVPPVNYVGSTIFHPFYGSDFSENNLVELTNGWMGDTLKVKFNSQIPENISKLGYPGLFIGYTVPEYSNLFGGIYTGPGATDVATTGGSGIGLTVDYVTLKLTGNSPIVSLTINNPGSGYISGDIITIPGAAVGDDATFIYNPGQFPNLTGWYSYKIVVKQTEQDYYNAYLPGILNGYVNVDSERSATKAAVSLYSDNINKIPRELQEVAPTQSNFNSNETLSLRVVNNIADAGSVQYYPGTDIEKVTQISQLSDLGVNIARHNQQFDNPPGSGVGPYVLTEFDEDKVFSGSSVIVTDTNGVVQVDITEGIYVVAYYAVAGNKAEVLFNKTPSHTIVADETITFGPPGVIYNSNNNPLIGILSTSTGIGVSQEDGFITKLAVAETKPFESALDIYYETTTAGLVSDLNELISQGVSLTGPIGITSVNFTLSERQSGSQVCTNNFSLYDSSNNIVNDLSANAEIISVFDGNNADRSTEFIINDLGNGEFNISRDLPVGDSYYVGDSLLDTDFNFNIAVSTDNQTFFKTFDGQITNEPPVYQGAYDGGSFATTSKGTFNWPITFNFEAYNGAADDILKKEDLQWELIQATISDGENNPAPPSPPPELDLNDTAVITNWPQGYFENPPAAGDQYAPWQFYKGQDVRGNLIQMYKPTGGAGYESIALNSWDMKFIFKGLNRPGAFFEYEYDPLGTTATNVVDYFLGLVGNLSLPPAQDQAPVTSSALIKFLEIQLKFQVTDRTGSGINAGIINYTLTVGQP